MAAVLRIRNTMLIIGLICAALGAIVAIIVGYASLSMSAAVPLAVRRGVGGLMFQYGIWEGFITYVSRVCITLCLL